MIRIHYVRIERKLRTVFASSASAANTASAGAVSHNRYSVRDTVRALSGCDEQHRHADGYELSHRNRTRLRLVVKRDGGGGNARENGSERKLDDYIPHAHTLCKTKTRQ